MITRPQYESARRPAAQLLERAGIVVRAGGVEGIEVADLGLGELEQTGLQILTLVSTCAIGVKVRVLLADQMFPQHKHPPLGDHAGKEETFRCQWGGLYLYTVGEPAPNPKAGSHLHTAGTLAPSGMSWCSARATSSPRARTPSIGSRPGRGVPWCGASHRAPLM